MADAFLETAAQPGMIGAPVCVKMDMWSLGCTIFEMLTGRLLFFPRRAAARKYHEFSSRALPVKLAEHVLMDYAEERAEQLCRRDIIGGKYKLVSKLGRGRFGSVWSAHELHQEPLGQSHKPLWEHAEAVASAARPVSEREQADRQWQREKGADDLIDLALNYEHILLIAALFGPVPDHIIKGAHFRSSYFQPNGDLRFSPAIRRISISERLRRGSSLSAPDRAGRRGFLKRLLTIDPAARITPKGALTHP